jgi:hypothetical protein
MAIGEIPPSAEVEAAEVGAVAPAPDVAAKNGVATA